MQKPLRKILVVDDELDLEHLMRQKFRHEIRRGEWDFIFAHDGVEALNILKQDSSIDMVLSDINMPHMDGLTLLDQIATVMPDIRAVIVSAYGDMENIRTAMNRGAYDFLTKPINFNDLKITVDKTLKHVSLLRNALRSRDQLVALHKELDVARQMQVSILPCTFPHTDTYQIQADMIPARGVAGDFYDIIELRNGKIALIMADVSGKGIPAALFMMVCRTTLKNAAITLDDPTSILQRANCLLVADNLSSMFVTTLICVLDPKEGTLTYANAGHERPLMLRSNGTIEKLDAVSGLVLGVTDTVEYRKASVRIHPGDILVTYTDGVTEAENTDGEQFGMQRLCETLLSRFTGAEAREATEGIVSAVQDFSRGTQQLDDITCMSIRYGKQP